MGTGEYSLIKQAYTAYRNGRYRDAIVILESRSLQSGSSYTSFLLALCYLHADKIGKAESVIRRVKVSHPDYLPVLYLEAFLVLKSAADRDSAMQRYVALLDRFPNDKLLKKAFKRISDSDNFQEFQRKARLKDFVPVPRPGPLRTRKKSRRYITKTSSKIIFTSLLLVVFSIPVTFSIYYWNSIADFFVSFTSLEPGNINEKKSFSKDRNIMEMVTLDGAHYDIIEKYSKKKTNEFYYSSETLKKDFNRAKKLIKEEEFNNALVLLNKINASNVHHRVKDRIEFLRDFILDIEDRPVSGYDFERVNDKPYLYQGIKIHWKGKIANLKEKEDHITCNLMVNYTDSHRFSGIAELYSEKKSGDIENGQQVEVIASFVDTVGKENRIYLVADSIKIIGE